VTRGSSVRREQTVVRAMNGKRLRVVPFDDEGGDCIVLDTDGKIADVRSLLNFWAMGRKSYERHTTKQFKNPPGWKPDPQIPQHVRQGRRDPVPKDSRGRLTPQTLAQAEQLYYSHFEDLRWAPWQRGRTMPSDLNSKLTKEYFGNSNQFKAKRRPR